jgi:hypothetical protein
MRSDKEPRERRQTDLSLRKQILAETNATRRRLRGEVPRRAPVYIPLSSANSSGLKATYCFGSKRKRERAEKV